MPNSSTAATAGSHPATEYESSSTLTPSSIARTRARWQATQRALPRVATPDGTFLRIRSYSPQQAALRAQTPMDGSDEKADESDDEKVSEQTINSVFMERRRQQRRSSPHSDVDDGKENESSTHQPNSRRPR